MIAPVVVFVIGLGLLGWGFFRQRKRDVMDATPTLTCAEIAAGAQPVTCEVKGAATPGPRGAVRAPFSGHECVWYRAKVTVRYEHHEYRDGRRHTTTRERTVHDDTCPVPFGVQDGTGQILVLHEGASLDGASQSVERYEPAGQNVNLFGLNLRVNFSNVKGHRYQEWIVPPGQPMYVLGAAGVQDRQLTMRRPDGSPFIISAISEEQLSRRLRIEMYVGYIGGGVVIAGSLVWLAIKALHG
ncbi:E3 ubiquitin ligase family protein [Actinoallomurus sp. NBC_01490]|uniref:GIDE domain-containing protein n=1 Tax=Actinoallomurus sp. NBC_01490 TaxID=2903557 RepID=UPI002E2EF937|nr:GIDE domain-containing protein [Actinoallomurus sp. NBC_01490]